MNISLARILVTALLAVVAIQTTQTTLAQEETKQYSIEQFLKTTSFNGSSFSHDNSKILVNSDQTGVFNAWSIAVAGGKMTQLTKSEKDSIFGVSYFPEDDRFFYTADQGGNELNHVYVQNTDGTTKDLTPGENLKASFGGMAQDNKSFFIVTNERDPKFFDVYEYQFSDFSREMIFENKDGYFPGSISNDGNYIALTKIHTRDNSDIYLYNLHRLNLV